METSRITILGCGSMGTNLMLGLLRRGSSTFRYSAHVNSSASAERLQKDLAGVDSTVKDRVSVSSGNGKLCEAVTGADVVLLGVPPTQLGTLLGCEGLVAELKGKIIVSMLAGVAISQIEDALVSRGFAKQDFHVARIIPTLGAGKGDSVTLLAEAGGEHMEKVKGFLSQIGAIVPVPESLMNSATAVMAAVHALAIVAVDAVTDASVAAGVPRSVAASIAAESLRSGSGLMSGNGAERMTPEQVKAGMSTPGGITLNALVSLDAKTRPGISSAVREAIEYTKKMND
ncbi:pyrroline-5-carboxylate reductase [Lecanosticta acicola]|uniref:Pyrroline-5-carboxylate reductase n=1 Tax=Lecanosticta acicola TaxID=111012 RepID=A0AAI8Z0T3_9PEZI|nr:pyrroline-5-carboxylate reductase [Lecanosticta acicola]